MAKSKRKGILRRPQSITGAKERPKSFKPQQARQLIRRFHVLQKNKHAILSRLRKKEGLELTEENYKCVIEGKSKVYSQSYEKSKVPVKYTDNELYKIDSGLSIHDLLSKLGEIDSEIDQRGGLDAYQIASTQGQNTKRGGDSSKKLIEWLKSTEYHYHSIIEKTGMNALEIGCLSPDNLISTCGIFKEVVKIDLNSQNPQILQQDFMERPLPNGNDEKFNLISCSLVVNFVPSPTARGDMLKRITQFLKPPTPNNMSTLFLVLPLPCITNSRYFDNSTLIAIMQELGFKQICRYEAKKVVYWLFDWQGQDQIKLTDKYRRKKNLYSGANRNNFCILLQ